ncbi:MAG TPA: hypothetical protein VGH28_15265 [Polyangiaceae bacterium]|jgi:hypothetical protein
MRSPSAVLGALALAGVGLVQCLGPTEIEVELSTDVPCANVKNAAIAVGPAGDDSRAVSATTTICSTDGGIGTLYVTPSGGIDDEVEIRATLGVSAQADQCAAPDFAGCVVARRQLRFDPHTRLVLPIELEQDCVDKQCDPNSTCVGGACVDAGVAECASGICSLGGAPDASPASDAGCSPIGPVTVSGIPFAPRLHVLRLGSNTFAVAWEDGVASGARNLVAATIDAGGSVGQPVTLGSVAAAGDSFSDVGTDGTSFAAARIVSGALTTVLVPIQGGALTTTPATPVVISSLSPRGFLQTAPGHFVFLGGHSSGTGVDAIDWAAASSSFTPTPIDTTDVGQPAELMTSNGLTFVTFANGDGTCTLYTCSGAFPSSSCPKAIVGECSGLHAGATASQSVILGVLTPAGTTSAYKVGSGLSGVLSNSNSQALVLPAGADNVRVVWGDVQDFYTELVDDSGSALAQPKIIATASPTLADFDALGGPGDEWAYVYYDATKQQMIFGRLCQ